MEIDLGYRPRPQFTPYHRRTERWSALVCHRRAGKTVATVADLIDSTLRCPLPNARTAYVAPTYVQAKDVAWEYAKRFSAPIPNVTFNESELRIDYPNGGRLRLYGAENYDRMRGLYLDDVVMDEAADFPPQAWPEVIRPALADRKGRATFIGTPKGKNAFYDLCARAKGEPDWFYALMRASETGIVDREELDDARKEMTPEQFAQEFECSFESAVIGAYYGAELEAALGERPTRITSVPPDPALPVSTYWDLGIDDATAIWFAQEVGKEIHLIEYAEWTNQALTDIAREVMNRPYAYAQHVLPHDVRAREMTTGRTREEVMRSILGRVEVAPMLAVEDGINAVRTIFPRLWIDETKCHDGLECLRNYRKDWDEKLKTFKPRPLHNWASHGADALRQLGVTYREKLQVSRAPRYQRGGAKRSVWV